MDKRIARMMVDYGDTADRVEVAHSRMLLPELLADEDLTVVAAAVEATGGHPVFADVLRNLKGRDTQVDMALGKVGY